MASIATLLRRSPTPLVTTLLAAAAAAAAAAPAAEDVPLPLEVRRPIEVVFLLDQSGSMDHLLDASRARIWDVVGTLDRLRPAPELHIGLVGYGLGSAGKENGWVALHSDLTSDLDELYRVLMSLETGGGEERVGAAMRVALDDLGWSAAPDALKILFVAGNETLDQGGPEHDFRPQAARARERGILVNTLYAGPRNAGIAEGWPELARLGGGVFAAVEVGHNLQIATPQDDDLLELNRRLVDTYMPYGEEGEDGLANHIAQDLNASRLGVQSCSSRIVAKGSALYDNAAWDLVDATTTGAVDLDELPRERLPAGLRELDPQALRARVDAARRERETIQERIQTLSDQREAFIRKALAEADADADGDFGRALRETLASQARAHGFDCPGCGD